MHLGGVRLLQTPRARVTLAQPGWSKRLEGGTPALQNVRSAP
jgi:hypothetical protein